MEEGEQKSKDLLAALEELSVGSNVKIDIKGLETSQDLEDDSRGDHGTHTELHQSAVRRGGDGSGKRVGV